MRFSRLERKLVAGILLLFGVPTIVAGAVVFVLHRQGALEGNPTAVMLTVAIGFASMMGYLALVAHGIGRALVQNLQTIQLGTELMASGNPDHRLDVRTGDELQSLAEEINRMADRVRDARGGLERQVAQATRDLEVERAKLSSVLEALGEGVVVATVEGRVSLANGAARELLGTGGAGLLGRSLFEHVDREKVAHYLERLRASGGGAERFSLEPRSGVVLDTVMTPFFDPARGMIGFVLVFRDVSQPARAEERRQRALAETLRELRGPLASVRSLAESLLGVTSSGAPDRRLLEALHAEAVRLSGLVREMGQPGRLGLAGAPWHFERVSLADIAAMALRRLKQEGADGWDRVRIASDLRALPPLTAEASALSGALASVLRAVLGRRAAADVWVRAARRGGVAQIDVGAEGHAALGDLEAALDAPAPAGRLTARDNVRRHAGEAWGYVGEGRFGLRLTLPLALEQEGVAVATGDAPPAPRFIGAGTASGTGAGAGGTERPDIYDFSLLEEMERHLRPDHRERALDALTCVVFDTETTGLDPEGDRIVSIAGVKVRAGLLRRGETFDALVNPARPIPAASARFHGITDAMVAEAPPIDVVLPAFLRFADGAVLVGHQVWFDLAFLARAAERLGLAPLAIEHPALDTFLLSAAVHGPLEGHGLDAMATRFGVAIRGRHSALGDALATAEIFVRLLELLGRRGIRTLGQALDAARRASRRAAR